MVGQVSLSIHNANCCWRQTESLVRPAGRIWTLHEPQSAAGILPAEEPGSRSADETSAAPCWRHYPTRSKFMVQMHGIKAVGLSMTLVGLEFRLQAARTAWTG